MNIISNQIKKRREELGWTQEYLAELLGYKSKSSINKIERGINDIVYSKILEFAKVLDITPAYIMGWTEVKEKPSSEKNPNKHSLKPSPIPIIDDKTDFKSLSKTDKVFFYGVLDSKLSCDYAFKSTSPNLIKARIYKGDIVFIKKSSLFKDDDICLLKLNGKLSLKRYKTIPDRKLVSLHGENPTVEDLFFTEKEISKLEIIGKCIAFQGLVK